MATGGDVQSNGHEIAGSDEFSASINVSFPNSGGSGNSEQRRIYVPGEKESTVFKTIDPSCIVDNGMKVLGSGSIRLPSCIDAVVFEEYLVLIYEDNVCKTDIATDKVVSKLKMDCPQRLCSIRQTSDVAVLQMMSSVTVIGTANGLTVKYRINVDKPYATICHLDTYTKTAERLPDPNYIFCVSYMLAAQANDMLAIVKAKISSLPQRKKRLQVYDAEVRELKAGCVEKGISGMASLNHNTIIVGCSTGVQCLKYGRDLILQALWTINMAKAATDVCVRDKLVYACVQDEGRVAMLNSEGHILSDNVLPQGMGMRPSRISVRGKVVLIREFHEPIWRNLLHEVEK